MSILEVVFWTTLFIVLGSAALYKIMEAQFMRDIDLDMQDADLYDDQN